MAKFNVGDRVRVLGSYPGDEQYNGVVTQVDDMGLNDPDQTLYYVQDDEGYGTPAPFVAQDLRKKSLPATDTKSLREKYKASGETPQNKARRVLMGRFPDKGEAVEMYLSHLGPDLDDLDDTRRIADFRAMLSALED